MTSCLVYRGNGKFKEIDPKDVIAPEDLPTIPLTRSSMEKAGPVTSLMNSGASPDSWFYYIFAGIIRYRKPSVSPKKKHDELMVLVRQIEQFNEAHCELSEVHAELMQAHRVLAERLRRLLCVAQSAPGLLPENPSELNYILEGPDDQNLSILMGKAGLELDALSKTNPTPDDRRHVVLQLAVPPKGKVMKRDPVYIPPGLINQGRLDLAALRRYLPTWAELRDNIRAQSSFCEHGCRRQYCKECDGPAICEHGRRRYQCKECDGPGICEHGRVRYRCKECDGPGICEHGRRRYDCKECDGPGICEHGRLRKQCKECDGPAICEHGRERYACKECDGPGICEHGRRRNTCKECDGPAICEHGRRRSTCKECSPHNFCTHGRRRYRCKECKK